MMEKNPFDTNGEECDDGKYDTEEYDDCAGNGETSCREPAAETVLLCEDGMILIFINIIPIIIGMVRNNH